MHKSIDLELQISQKMKLQLASVINQHPSNYILTIPSTSAVSPWNPTITRRDLDRQSHLRRLQNSFSPRRPFPEMKNRLHVSKSVHPGGPCISGAVISTSESYCPPTVGPPRPLHCFTRPNKRNYNPRNVNPSLFFLLNALAWSFGRFKCIRSCPSHPLQFLPIG